MPDQINPNHTLFGGILMSWIDMTAFMCAERHSGTARIVTASIDRLDFVRPVYVGNHVLLSARVEYVGTSSMSIEVHVEMENPLPVRKETVAIAHLTFVALDEQGRPRPVPPLDVSTEDEKNRFYSARIRYRVHHRFRRWKEKRDLLPLGHSERSAYPP
jgi:acyl-CoA hydrolase